MIDGLNSAEDGGLFPRVQHRYGLRADPLDMDAPFFPDAGRQHALETLRHLCGFGDMALLVTGAPGAGKTRLLGELIRSEASRLDMHRLPSASLTSVQALVRHLRSIAPALGHTGDVPRDVVFAFFRWSEARARKGQRMVVMLDDADRVAPELLRLVLSAFLAADRASAAVPVFAGSQGLLESLGIEGSAEGVSVHQVDLRPLGPEELFAYLKVRVEMAGGKVSELLGHKRLDQLHQLSQGSFGRLKRVGHGVWLDQVALRPAAPGRKARLSTRSLAWPALGVLLLGGSWWYVSWQYDQTVARDRTVAAQPAPTRRSVTVGPGEAPDLPSQTVTSRAEPPKPAPPEVGSSSVAISPAQSSEAPPPQAEVPKPETTGVMEPGTAAGAVTGPTSLPAATSTGIPATDVPLETASAKVVAPDSAAPNNAPRSAAPEVMADTPAVKPKQPSFEPALGARFRPIDQLRARSGWTLQLVAGHQEKTAVSLIRQYPQLGDLWYTRIQRNGEPWYLVVAGAYGSLSAAQQAKAALPESLQKQSPWIRRNQDL